MIFVVHLEEEKVPGHGVVDTCSLAGLFPGVRRSSVSFVFSFKILILAMQPGCVELLSHPSSHMQELGLLLLHHPWRCCSFCGLFCVKSCLSFFFSKLVRNFWRRPSLGGKRKGFLLVRKTSKGGGVAMSADTCPGLSTGPLLPGDSGWFWDLWLKRSTCRVPRFHWGWRGEEGGKKGGRERKRDGRLIFKETLK